MSEKIGDLWDSVEINGQWVTKEQWGSLEYSRKIIKVLATVKRATDDLADIQWLESPHKAVERCVNELDSALDELQPPKGLP